MCLDCLCTYLKLEDYSVPYRDTISTQPTDLGSRVEMIGLSSEPGMSFQRATPAAK